MFMGVRLVRVVGVRAGVVVGVMGALMLGACVHSDAERAVASQNAANAGVLAANIEKLGAAVRESSRVECEVVVRRAREGVARELVRVRNTILVERPTEAEIGDASALWVSGLQREVEAVSARMAVAAVDQRAGVARSLAEECAATVDVAVGTAGFTVGRVLRDAVEMDRVNGLIEAERNAAVRAGLMARRDAIVDAYLAVRVAMEATGKYRDGVERFLLAVGEQAQVMGLHAEAMVRGVSGRDARGAVGGVIGNTDVRAAVLEIVSREWGSGVAADVKERLERVQRVIEGR
jgi:hypothetical protein